MTSQAAERIDLDDSPMETIRAHQAEAPVPVTKLAEALGLPVFEEAGWPSHVSGLIERADPEVRASSGYQIVIRKDDVERRKRFTIAHEIAHYILHRDQIGDRLQDNALYRSNLSSKAEAEANRMAADILMPRDLIEEALRGPDQLCLERLATQFQVSNVAMAIRLGIPTD